MPKSTRTRKFRCDGCKTVLYTITSGSAGGGTVDLRLPTITKIKVISIEKSTHLITCKKCGHSTHCVIPFSIYKERLAKEKAKQRS